MEENAISRAAVIDGRMFEAYDAWEDYAQERCLENPWDIEEEMGYIKKHAAIQLCETN